MEENNIVPPANPPPPAPVVQQTVTPPTVTAPIEPKTFPTASKNHTNRWIILLLFVILLIIGTVMGAYFFLNTSKKDVPKEEACTNPPKVCPDGSSVFPIGSKCEFPACPKNSTKQSATENNLVWDVPEGIVSSSVEKELKSAFSAYKPSSTASKLAVVYISVSTVSADFASGSIQERDENNKPLQTDGILILIHKIGGIWKIIDSSDTTICHETKTFPKDLLTESIKDNFAKCFVIPSGL